MAALELVLILVAVAAALQLVAVRLRMPMPSALLDQRDRGQIDDVIARHIERYLDLQTMLLDYPDWDIDESPFEVLTPPPDGV